MLAWQRILDVLRTSTPLGYFMQARDPRDSVTFTIAMIALSAKLAKADGRVVISEVAAFRDVFTVEPGQEDAVARVYDLCRKDAAGYREYARQIVRLFGTGAPILEDIMDALFHVALADGGYNEEEDGYLETVGGIFGLTPRCMARLKARHVPDYWNPYSVLGVEATAEPRQIRERYRLLVRRNHPDVLRANGLPEEMMELANQRLADINRAYAELTEKAA
jgi:DnaJ like chaperone protein